MRFFLMAPLKAPFLVVKKSKINGRGVFSSIPLKKDVCIIEYIGKRKKWQETRFKKRTRVWVMASDKDFVIDGSENGNSARYINHSCKPNCIAILMRKRVFIETIRKIEPNEEITIDYNLKFCGRPTKEDLLFFQCNCKNSKCRGTLLGN